MKTPIYTLTGVSTKEITLPKAVFDTNAPPSLIAQSIRVYLSNQRRAAAKTKDRGAVVGTTKKMYAQKGTGRARHSTAKAPQFVGGGSAHGPTGFQNYSLKLSKKLAKRALFGVLTNFAKSKSIIVVDGLSKIDPKTKSAVKFIDILGKDNKAMAESNIVGIISAKSRDNIKRAFGNLPGFNLLSLESLNVYDLSCQNFLVITVKAVNDLAKK